MWDRFSYTQVALKHLFKPTALTRLLQTREAGGYKVSVPKCEPDSVAMGGTLHRPTPKDGRKEAATAELGSASHSPPPVPTAPLLFSSSSLCLVMSELGSREEELGRYFLTCRHEFGVGQGKGIWWKALSGDQRGHPGASSMLSPPGNCSQLEASWKSRWPKWRRGQVSASTEPQPTVSCPG